MLSDTDSKIENKLFNMLATLAPEVKFQKMNDLCAFGRQLMVEGIKQQYPNADSHEIKVKFAERVLGVELAAKLYQNAK